MRKIPCEFFVHPRDSTSSVLSLTRVAIDAKSERFVTPGTEFGVGFPAQSSVSRARLTPTYPTRMRSGGHQFNALHRVIVGVCSALILVLAAASLFESGGLTEDPETHAPLDPRGAVIGIPIGVGGLVFAFAGIGIGRRRRDQYRTLQSSHRAMPRVDRIDAFSQEVAANQQQREQRKVFWTTPQPTSATRRRRKHD